MSCWISVEESPPSAALSADALNVSDLAHDVADPQPWESVSEESWEDLQQAALNPFRSPALSRPFDPSAANKRPDAQPGLQAWWSDLTNSLVYWYYCWREDSWSDLQLFLALNLAVIGVGVAVKYLIVDVLDGQSATHDFWQSLYQVLVLAFGENFPQTDGRTPDLPQQVFAIATAGAGLVSFALVLALVEQVVLENVEENVKRGSPVITSGHTVLLMWGASQRDIEMTAKILSQVCLAHQGGGGTTVAVLSQRAKLEMEQLFRRVLPTHARLGTRLVFRQGSPLVGEDLHMVACASAAATIIVSDNSRNPDEADAQAVRTAVLLDELDFPGFGVPDPRTGVIVVELKTSNALLLLRHNCSTRVMPVPTNQLNARRLARMFEHPIVADVSKSILSFHSASQLYVQPCPAHLRSLTFGQLLPWFPDGIVLGLLHRHNGTCLIAPPPSHAVGDDMDIVMVRPTRLSNAVYRPAPAPVQIQTPPDFHPHLDTFWPQWAAPALAELPYATTAPSSAAKASRHPAEPPLYPLTAFESSYDGAAADDIVPFASGRSRNDSSGLRRSTGSFKLDNGAWGETEAGSGIGSGTGAGDSDNENGLPELLHGCYFGRVAAAPLRARSVHTLPLSLNSPDELEHGKCLICGWAESSFMGDVLRELDRGTSALQPGTHVTLFNTHSTGAIEAAMRDWLGGPPRNIRLTHVRGNPLHRHQLQQLNISQEYRCVLVLCDSLWIDPDGNAANGVEHAAQPDFLRIDSMVMMTQLVVRHIMTVAGCTSINIICEKVAFQGVTRFEDRHRLPLGVSVNFTSHAAKLLTQVAFDARSLVVYTSFGTSNLGVCDSAELAGQDEALSFWQLQMRAQGRGWVLLGYFVIPGIVQQPINATLNPIGNDARSEVKAANLKFGYAFLQHSYQQIVLGLPADQYDSKTGLYTVM
ncbi:hypothetical protein WJX73_002178 [Symbiochloris irregularis]|uniref:Uncharacterized protein n=1 Tax=Symbiochloris irregularis TaxID=706552 RepID=A0AAW1NZW0_9CHLO